MKKKILAVLLLIISIGIFNNEIKAADIKVGTVEYISNYAEIDDEADIRVSPMSDYGEIGYNETYVPKDGSTIDGDWAVDKPTYGFIYHHAEIYFLDGTYLVADQNKDFVLSDYVKEVDLDKVDDVTFYYSASGKVNVSYKLDTIDGKQIIPMQSLNGRFASSFKDSKNQQLTFRADSFSSARKDIQGYKFIKMVGSDNELYVNGEKNVTYIYEKIKPIEPVKPVKPKPVKPISPKPDKKKPVNSKKEIAKTGQNIDSLFTISLALGTILFAIYFVKKKRI